MRETLFNWLGQDLSGCVCLDLFAGSGALGFEAASRGAERVTLVERNQRGCRSLRDNCTRLQASQVEVVCGDAIEFMATCDRRYDVAFLDPPYRQGWLEKLVESLTRVMQPDGVLYLEAEREMQAYGPWTARRHRHSGQVHYHLMGR